MTEALILTILSIFLGLGLVPAVAVVAARLKGQHWAGRRVMLKWADVRYGDLLAEGTFFPVGVLDEAVVTVARRQGDWLATSYRGETVWFPLDASVPLEQAPDYFRSRIRGDPADAFARHRRALAWQALGQLDRAVADFTEAVRLDPNNPLALDGLARLHATCPAAVYRDGPRAVEYAFRACDLTGWKWGMGIDTLAAAYAEAGAFEQAVRCQEQALTRTDFPADKQPGARERIALYQARRPYRE